MNTIDWSNAPEGTTHYRPENEPCWYKVAGDTAYYWSLALKWDSSPEFESKRLLIGDMIARPELVWNGEGKPPVGTVCEYKHEYNYEWFKADVLFVGDQIIVLGTDEEEVAYFVDCLHFRPIKTAEQIAAEEREKAVENMLGVILNLAKDTHPDCTDICEGLYDAGYRRVEDK